MAMTALRRLEALPRAESLRLLSTVSLGRLVFTHLALPAIRPVNHAVAGDQVIIRAYLGTAISTAVRDRSGTVVAYEADLIDPDTHLGWSVIIVGRATRITDPAEAAGTGNCCSRGWPTGRTTSSSSRPTWWTGSGWSSTAV